MTEWFCDDLEERLSSCEGGCVGGPAANGVGVVYNQIIKLPNCHPDSPDAPVPALGFALLEEVEGPRHVSEAVNNAIPCF